MKIGVLGTGMVGNTLATKLRELGHDVQIGSRSAGDDAVPFADAAAHGELVFNCTAGTASLEALGAAGADGLFGWPADRIHDLGDITSARAMEMYLPLWLKLMGVVGSPTFNIRVVH